VCTNSTGVQGTSVLPECLGTVEVYRCSTGVQWVQVHNKGTGVLQGHSKSAGIQVYMGTSIVSVVQECRRSTMIQFVLG